MMNSYRFAIFLMVLFGVVGIQAARHQPSSQLADATNCANSRSIASSKTTVAKVEEPKLGVQASVVEAAAAPHVHPVKGNGAAAELASNDSL